jgi:hypothetical protein
MAAFCSGWCYQSRLKGVSTHGISVHVDAIPLVIAQLQNWTGTKGAYQRLYPTSGEPAVPSPSARRRTLGKASFPECLYVECNTRWTRRWVYIGLGRVYFALGVFAVSCSDYNTLIEVSLVTLYGFATYTFGSVNFKWNTTRGKSC